MAKAKEGGDPIVEGNVVTSEGSAIEIGPTRDVVVKDNAAVLAAETRSPRGWAEKLGHIIKADPRIPQATSFPDMAYAAADVLHGWSQHEHHYQSLPLKLTQEAYEAARHAGLEHPCKPAHGPAISPTKMAAEHAAAWLEAAKKGNG